MDSAAVHSTDREGDQASLTEEEFWDEVNASVLDSPEWQELTKTVSAFFQAERTKTMAHVSVMMGAVRHAIKLGGANVHRNAEGEQAIRVWIPWKHHRGQRKSWTRAERLFLQFLEEAGIAWKRFRDKTCPLFPDQPALKGATRFLVLTIDEDALEAFDQPFS